MPGKIYRYLADDQACLESLLRRATARPDSIGLETYAAFRAGLLKHISMEKKTLLPGSPALREKAGVRVRMCCPLTLTPTKTWWRGCC